MRRSKRAIVFTLAGLLLVPVVWSQSQEVMNACDHLKSVLVGWWKMDDVGTSWAIDSSEYGNDGELVGEWGFIADGLVDEAVDFAGESAGIVVPWDPSLEPATGTFEAWIRLYDQQTSDIIMKRTDKMVRTERLGAYSVYGLRIQSDWSVMAYILNDDPEAESPWTIAVSKPGIIWPGEWHHVAMRWDGRKFDLFVNGRKRDSVLYDPVPDLGLSYHDPGYYGLGIATYWEGGEEYIGHLDDVRLYEGPRSNWQIWADYRLRGRDEATHPRMWKNFIKKLKNARRRRK